MSEKYRPNLHFAPKTGWMNDPNGMLLVDGTYHLFFQHDPDSIHHGPMHWGHAVSRDLVNWDELPIALYPDSLGTCFSGSAIETASGEIKLLYTAHRRDAEERDFQTQCLVDVDRTLTSFTARSGNPVLDNPGIEAFRDPKVIWHEGTQRWIMVLTLGRAIGFYASEDLVDWSHESTFEGQGRQGNGVWECPDLVALTAPDGRNLWVLIVSLSTDAYGPGSGTQYFVGDFDGFTFTNANPADTELWLDYGRDHYAVQTFFDRSGGDPIAMAWGSNWAYARQTPTEQFRGLMTLPRILQLVETPDGFRLAQSVPAQVRAAFAQTVLLGTFHQSISFDLALGQTGTITLFGETAPHYLVTRTSPDTVRLQTNRADHPGLNGFGHAYAVDLPYPAQGGLIMDLYVDRGLVELSTEDGLVWLTNLFYPTHPEGPLRFSQPESGQTGNFHTVHGSTPDPEDKGQNTKEAHNG